MESSISSFFNYVSETFPVMCASDEFHFMPRAQKASHYYRHMENLESDAIAEYIARLKQFNQIFQTAKNSETDLSKSTDFEMLTGSIQGILIELEKKAAFFRNPLIYLKIGFIGVDHSICKPADSGEQRMERFLSRLGNLPVLLQQAEKNLQHIPEHLHNAARSMIPDCRAYLRGIEPSCFSGFGREIREKTNQAMDSLKRFAHFLESNPPVPDSESQIDTLTLTLKDHFLSKREPSEIFELASRQWIDTMAALGKIEKKMGKPWRDSLANHRQVNTNDMDTMSLYRGEIQRLESFFQRTGFSPLLPREPLELSKTPRYLLSVRSSGSFSAAFSDDPREKYHFYITPGTDRKTEGKSLKLRLHQEYLFLSAHETIPGHFLLDSVRRKLKNPVRRQIESPLFHEGWAYHAEQLLIDYGYTHSIIDRLINYKRRLWRTARCLIDVGVATNRLSRQKSVELLTACGFNLNEARGQVKRFALNPGYQLCYTLGQYEILRLKKRHAPRMGTQSFYKELLKAGQVPFHLADRILAKKPE